MISTVGFCGSNWPLCLIKPLRSTQLKRFYICSNIQGKRTLLEEKRYHVIVAIKPRIKSQHCSVLAVGLDMFFSSFLFNALVSSFIKCKYLYIKIDTGNTYLCVYPFRYWYTLCLFIISQPLCINIYIDLSICIKRALSIS